MIKLTAVTGPYAGQVREPDEEVDPFVLLCEFARHDWKWHVDHYDATEGEALRWGQADMVARILAALTHGRAVFFGGAEYRVTAPHELAGKVGEVEDAIAYSGLMVTVVRDDEHGVVIGARGTEHPVQ
jgi:hypothetical protein